MEKTLENLVTTQNTLDSWATLRIKVTFISHMLSTVLYILGGRTLLVHLDSGETLDLFCEDCQAGVYGITVCISLATKDESNALDMETHADFNRALYSSRYGLWN